MKLTIQIKEIDLYDVILKAMPIMSESALSAGSTLGKILSVATQLPPDVIRTMCDAVSQKDKHEILTLLVHEHKDKLLETLSQLLRKNQIEASLDDISLSNELELSIAVSNVNHSALAARYLPLLQDSPIIQENPVSAMLAVLLKLPKMFLSGALSKMTPAKKDDITVHLINNNKGNILAKLENTISNQGIHICLSDLQAEV